MKYLVKLVTPKNGVILEPFAGSGTTLLAAKELGYDFVGVELEKDYVDICNKRLATLDKPMDKFIGEKQ